MPEEDETRVSWDNCHGADSAKSLLLHPSNFPPPIELERAMLVDVKLTQSLELVLVLEKEGEEKVGPIQELSPHWLGRYPFTLCRSSERSERPVRWIW